MPLLKLLSTGSSKGNCYQYRDILIDFGVPYGRINDYEGNKSYPIKTALETVNYIFISHVHSDHLNISAVKKVKELYPKIIFIGGEHLREKFTELGVRFSIVSYDKPSKFGNYVIELVEMRHDVDNWTCRIVDLEHKKKGIYITDTNTVEHIEYKDYDFVIIEANHDKEEADRVIKEVNDYNENLKDGEKPRFTHFIGSVNSHLNFDQAYESLHKNCTPLKTEVMLVHLSSHYKQDEYDYHFIYEKGIGYK